MDQSEARVNQSVDYLYRPDARPRVESMRRSFAVVFGIIGVVPLVFVPMHLVLIILTVLGVLPPDQADLGNSIGVVLIAPLGAVFVTSGAMNTLIEMADITVSQEGLILHLIGQRHQFIAWDQIRDEAFIDVPYLMDSKLNAPRGRDTRPIKFRVAGVFDPRWNRRQPRTAFALRVSDLPIYFRVVGLFYRLGLTGIILVTPDHDRYEELQDKIVAYLSDHQ